MSACGTQPPRRQRDAAGAWPRASNAAAESNALHVAMLPRLQNRTPLLARPRLLGLLRLLGICGERVSSCWIFRG